MDRGRLIGFASVRDGMAAALTVILAAAWFGTTAAGSAAASSRTPGSCDPTWHVVHPPNPGPFYNELNDITGTSSTDLWTVGWYTNVSNGSSLTLAEHWDGTQWTAIPTPTPGDRGELASVAAIAPEDVWAVGETFRQSPDLYPRSLVEHWDGSAWSVVTLSGATIRGGLLSVFALSASDVWAVGFAGSQTHQRTNILHWDGSTWSRVPAPSPGAGGALRDIHGLGPNDLWAVGISGPGTLTEHWDGSSWTSVPVPNPGYYIDGLHAVAEVAPNDAWAGGMSEGNNNGLEWTRWHWDGQTWTTSLSDPASNDPSDIAADASNDVFVAGTGGPSLNEAEVDHFDGSTWTREYPNGTVSGDARGITLVGQDVWIAGDYRLQDGRFQTMVAVRCHVA